ncbi:hypothetical protein DFH28DRAFT_952886 [Melampsora americana]|nr:hypothetical protein DFH28DRAFT_952886 [Melampsora americana]
MADLKNVFERRYLDFLIDPITNLVIKHILHSNIPGEAIFARYSGCPWEILLQSRIVLIAIKTIPQGVKVELIARGQSRV